MVCSPQSTSAQVPRTPKTSEPAARSMVAAPRMFFLSSMAFFWSYVWPTWLGSASSLGGRIRRRKYARMASGLVVCGT